MPCKPPWCQAASGSSASGKPVGERNAYPMAVYPDSSHVAFFTQFSNVLSQGFIQGDTLAHVQPFYYLHSLDNSVVSVGGMAFDSEGNLWVATSAGLQMLDQNGRVRAIFSLPTGIEFTMAFSTTLAIEQGQIILSDNQHQVAWRRPFRVQPPTPGVRPKSQGQG